MRISRVIFASIIVGLAAGVVSGLWRTDLFSSSLTSGAQAMAAGNSDLPALPADDGPQPIAEVDNPHYNFGHMERMGKGEHAFLIKNTGAGPLVLSKGRSTCKCTLSAIDKTEVAPGESTAIKLTWEAKGDSSQFRHGATIYTNDRLHRVITLDIEGTLVDTLALDPPEIVFSNLTADEETSGRTRLSTVRSDDLAVAGHTFENEETAPFFAVTTQPLSPDKLPPGAKSGCEVIVTVKPGLPPGAIHQTIRLKTNLNDAAEVPLKIEGRIGTPVMIVGRDWNPDSGLLRLGVVPRNKGATSEVKVMIRGPHRKQIQLQTPRTDPEWLVVKLGQAQDLGNVVAVPVTIEIPPDAPTVNRLGNATGPLGTIKIASDPPEMAEIHMNVGFAVAE